MHHMHHTRSPPKCTPDVRDDRLEWSATHRKVNMNMRQQIPDLAVFLAAMLLTAVPAQAEVSWGTAHRFKADPESFAVRCVALTDAGEISHLDCYGSWNGSVTPHCTHVSAAEYLECSTYYTPVACPEGGASAWGFVYGSIEGDNPDHISVAFNDSCIDGTEW